MASTSAPSSTQLALVRTRLAHERTLMAWVRTATSLISFGFTIYKFFQYLRQTHPVREVYFGPREFAMTMLAIGLASLVAGLVSHHRAWRELRDADGKVPRSLASWVAFLVAALGVIGLVLVWLRQ